MEIKRNLAMIGYKQKIPLFLFVFLLLFPGRLFSKDNNTVKIEIIYHITLSGHNSKIKFITTIPDSLKNRQSVEFIKFSPGTTRIFKANGDKFAEFVIYNPEEKEFDISIKFQITLYEYDLRIAEIKRSENIYLKEDLHEFLKDEKYIEKDDIKIQEIAKSINGKNDKEIIENVFSYVLNHLSYSGYNKADIGAIKTLVAKKGDCTDYADLFVAILRAKNIPARVIEGYTVVYGDTPKHNWAEAYIEDTGWVPFDPLLTDIRKAEFGKLKPMYIYLSNNRNIEIFNGYHFWAYWYWGDPISIKSSFKVIQKN